MAWHPVRQAVPAQEPHARSVHFSLRLAPQSAMGHLCARPPLSWFRRHCFDRKSPINSRRRLLQLSAAAVDDCSWTTEHHTVSNGLATSVAGVFEAYFGKRWRAAPLGMSGDTVAYLRWRLEHGELPAARPPRVAVLLVGTNDLRDAKALYEYEAGDGATVEGRSGAGADAARDIASRCCLLVRFETFQG